MQFFKKSHQAFGAACLAACLAVGGCASGPIPSSPHAMMLQSQSPSSLDNVHVIFVESPADLGHWGRIEEVCCSMRRMGLRNAVYFQPIVDGNSCDLVEYIRDIRSENPNSQIMLVGWSIGSLCVKQALTILEEDCDGVETVVYIDSGFLKLVDFTGHPDNADRVVLIYRAHQSPPRCIPNAEVHCVDTWFHFPAAHHRDTVDQLVQEAIDLTVSGSSAPMVSHSH